MDLADYLQTSAVLQRGGQASLAAPILHLETLDQATVSWCRDWRAEIRMYDLLAPAGAPVSVGAVDFVVVQLSEGDDQRSIADCLATLDVRAERFVELFDGGRLEPGLDEDDEFFDGMPMYSVLLILGAVVDDQLPPSRLREWALAEVCHTMLPTTSGVAFASAAGGGSRRRLVAVDHRRDLGPDWASVGFTTVPGHPAVVGRAALFTYLDTARDALSEVTNEVLTL
ncbi:hypothetical protein [Mycolicibacterium goodii]|uniref:hypothetical protein n=1 Tax=Mycolicibacterium goodii TaxID=134601 RepID=UPI001BDD5E73|nr:hypothetical protein [Mycolicibacterium goodii]MBU8841574.1 hypothetical protein [Mycolicibacterium goodii]